MRNEVKRTIKTLRDMGLYFTIDGPFLADFIEKLDELVEVLQAEFTGSKIDILVGVSKEPSPQQILEVVTMATLLNVTASGVEQTPWGLKIWFEWYVHAQPF